MKKPHYNIAERNDTAIISCHYNAVGWKSTTKNALRYIDSIKSAGYPLFMVECLYPGQEATIPDARIVRSDSIMWHCNNLFNIEAKRIIAKYPQYTKFLFIDADVIFSDPDWYNKSSRLLDDNDIIQPFETLDRQYAKIDNYVRRLISNQSKHDKISNRRCPGMALGMRKDWYEKINGLYEKGYLGGNDTLTFILNTGIKRSLLKASYSSDIAIDIENRIRSRKKSRYFPKMSFVRGNTAYHLFHGLPLNREYKFRYKKWPIKYSAEYNQDGVMEFPAQYREEYNGILLKYFQNRKEDGGLGSVLWKYLKRIGISIEWMGEEMQILSNLDQYDRRDKRVRRVCMESLVYFRNGRVDDGFRNLTELYIGEEFTDCIDASGCP